MSAVRRRADTLKNQDLPTDIVLACHVEAILALELMRETDVTRSISIDELQIGMFVTGFDRSWFRTPFLRHRFLVRSSADIQRLRRSGIQTVEIDLARGTPPVATVPPDADELPGVRVPSVKGTPLSKGFDGLRHDLRLAMEVRKKLEHTVHCLFDNIAAMGTINHDQAHEAAQEIGLVAKTLSHPALFMAMSQMPEASPGLSQHAMATCTLSMILGQSMQYDLATLQDLAVGALLHDIGLLHVPSSILRRVYDSSYHLGDRERAVYEMHARQGAVDLERQQSFSLDVRRILAEHHALPDGRGFPREINPRWISQSSRIVMIADQYDELLTGFGGRTPMQPHEALHRLYHCAQDGGLDLDLTSTFIKRVGVFPIYSTVELNTGERGVIAELNPAQLHLPVIFVTHMAGGKALASPLRIDLLQQQDGPSVRTIVRILKSGACASVSAD